MAPLKRGAGRVSWEGALHKTWIHKEETFPHLRRPPRHFNALTDLRFCLCHLCFMFLLLYPVPSHPVSSRNGSETPRICPSSLFSTLMCCCWCLLQTDMVMPVKSALRTTYFTWGRQLSAVQNWFPQNICTLKLMFLQPSKASAPSVRDSGWTVSDVKEKVHQYWLRGRATLPHL